MAKNPNLRRVVLRGVFLLLFTASLQSIVSQLREVDFHSLSGEYDIEASFAEFKNDNSSIQDNSSSSEESFSACLLIRDDNHWLIEWLAFHYHVLPLRDLIVVIDPHSKTSPRRIFQRWEGYINTEFWNATQLDKDSSEALPDSVHNSGGGAPLRDEHRRRQVYFYQECMKTFQRRSKNWVMLTDSDEFAIPNIRSSRRNVTDKDYPIDTPGSLLRFMNDEKNHRDLVPCFEAPRYQFGGKESNISLVETGVPSSLDGNLSGMDFLTTRWRLRQQPNMWLGKNFVNVGLLKPEDYVMGRSVHSVLGLCPGIDWKNLRKRSKLHSVKHQDSLAVLSHFSGTKEQFFFRDDPRDKEGGRSRYMARNRSAKTPDDDWRYWLKGFVGAMGSVEAHRLLEGVGQVGYE
jgi:hypothetical protein